MKSTLFTILLISILGGGLRTISQVNEYADKAARAYKQRQYQEATAAYEYLLNDLEVNDDQISLNLAHTYYNAGRFTEALHQYRLLADNPATHLRSVVHLQLGNIATKQKKYKQALSLYRQALVAEPDNEAARYNYELLKKYLNLHPERAEQPEEQLPEQQQTDSTALPPPAQEAPQPKQKPDTNGDQEEEVEQPQPDKNGQQGKGGSTPDQNEQEPQQQEKEQARGNKPGDKEGENSDNQFDEKQQKRSNSTENISQEDLRAQTQRTRLQKANISPERAKLLLDAMRNAEMQYIQQLPKKATKQPDKSKPDW